MTGFFIKIRSSFFTTFAIPLFIPEKRAVKYQHYIAIQLVEH